MTTPSTPPSRTIRFEPSPTDGDRDLGLQLAEEIGEIDLVGRA
jgi:hypothetical protein